MTWLVVLPGMRVAGWGSWVAVVATNADGTIVRWDHGAQALLGYPSRDVVGRPIADLLHPGADRGLGQVLVGHRDRRPWGHGHGDRLAPRRTST